MEVGTLKSNPESAGQNLKRVSVNFTKQDFERFIEPALEEGIEPQTFFKIAILEKICRDKGKLSRNAKREALIKITELQERSVGKQELEFGEEQNIAFAECVTDLCQNSGLSSADFARKADISASTLSRIERHDGRAPRVATIAKIASAAGPEEEFDDIFEKLLIAAGYNDIEKVKEDYLKAQSI